MTQSNTDPQPERGWREHAVCRDVDPELFFPTAEAGPALDTQVTAAKTVCAGCPVQAQCLTEALARIPYGIAGGLTEHERRRLRTTSPGRPAKPRQVQPDGPDRELNRQERAEVGHELLAAGRAPGQVASACRVSVRTVERWAARTRTSTSTTAQHGMGRGAAAATGLLSRSPQHTTPRQGHEHRKDTEGR